MYALRFCVLEKCAKKRKNEKKKKGGGGGRKGLLIPGSFFLCVPILCVKKNKNGFVVLGQSIFVNVVGDAGSRNVKVDGPLILSHSHWRRRPHGGLGH